MVQLTPAQVGVYERLLASPEISSIYHGRMNALYGIDLLRKCCNHPDLLVKEEERVGAADYASQAIKLDAEVRDQRALLVHAVHYFAVHFSCFEPLCPSGAVCQGFGASCFCLVWFWSAGRGLVRRHRKGHDRLSEVGVEGTYEPCIHCG